VEAVTPIVGVEPVALVGMIFAPLPSPVSLITA